MVKSVSFITDKTNKIITKPNKICIVLYTNENTNILVCYLFNGCHVYYSLESTTLNCSE